MIGATGTHPAARVVGGIGAAVYKPFSRGRVYLSKADPSASPVVEFNLLNDPRDLERMTLALEKCLRILQSPGVCAGRNEVFLPDPALARRLSGTDKRTLLRSAAVRAALEFGSLRRRLLQPLDIESLLEDPLRLRDLVLQITGVGGHVAGSCRMGDRTNADAVVDSCCRVLGVVGLRVVDASIMPVLVSANTNLTVQMIAERASDLILADRRAGIRSPNHSVHLQ